MRLKLHFKLYQANIRIYMIPSIITIKIIGLDYLIMLIKRLSTTVFRSYYKNYFLSAKIIGITLCWGSWTIHTSFLQKLVLCDSSRRQYWHLDCWIKHTAFNRRPLMTKHGSATTNSSCTHIHAHIYTDSRTQKQHEKASHWMPLSDSNNGALQRTQMSFIS